jgi:hypothetical protein
MKKWRKVETQIADMVNEFKIIAKNFTTTNIDTSPRKRHQNRMDSPNKKLHITAAEENDVIYMDITDISTSLQCDTTTISSINLTQPLESINAFEIMRSSSQDLIYFNGTNNMDDLLRAYFKSNLNTEMRISTRSSQDDNRMKYVIKFMEAILKPPHEGIVKTPAPSKDTSQFEVWNKSIDSSVSAICVLIMQTLKKHEDILENFQVSNGLKERQKKYQVKSKQTLSAIEKRISDIFKCLQSIPNTVDLLSIQNTVEFYKVLKANILK